MTRKKVGGKSGGIAPENIRRMNFTNVRFQSVVFVLIPKTSVYISSDRGRYKKYIVSWKLPKSQLSNGKFLVGKRHQRRIK